MKKKEVQQLDGELKGMQRKLMDAEEREDGEAAPACRLPYQPS